jgi:hypothetical protein
MRNTFILLLVVLAVWTGIEVINHGMGGAFDGLFVEIGLAQPDEGPEDTPVGRASERFESAYDRAEQRVDDQVE